MKASHDFYKKRKTKLQSWCKSCHLNNVSHQSHQPLLEKSCNTCGVVKSPEDFYANNRVKCGLDGQCKLCKKEARDKSPEIKAIRAAKEALRRKDPAVSLRIKKLRHEYNSNPESKERRNGVIRLRYKNDDNFRIRCNLRNRRKSACKVQNAHKSGDLENLLGMKVRDFVDYLKTTLPKNPHPKTGEIATWDHWVNGELHIDEIIPCSAWNMKDPLQQKLCFHYSNAQLLWGPDNIKKGGVNRRGMNKIYQEKIDGLIKQAIDRDQSLCLNR